MPIAGVREVVPAARTLLVHLHPHQISPQQLAAALARRDVEGLKDFQTRGALIDVPVVYDGEDLAAVARMLAVDVREVVQRHTGQEWFVAFTGFAPGFAYLAGGDPIFDVARRQTPRVKVPAGAVALAGRFSAVYPRESPGGWQLIGTTQTPMWDLSRAKPALLLPGCRVRFVDAGRQRQFAPALVKQLAQTSLTMGQRAIPAADGEFTRAHGRQTSKIPLRCGVEVFTPGSALRTQQAALRVKHPGIFTTFQDMGRPGLADQGISASGAMDKAAVQAANRLVGNASRQAVLETTGAGLTLQSQGDTVVAVTGADAVLTLATRDGRQWRVARYQAIALADGDGLRIGSVTAGLRCYVAVRGGFAVPSVLGSCATDTLSQIGPPPLTAGQCVPVLPLARHTAVAVFEPPPETPPAATD